ncbi:MAG: toll/interleukin-1 receptor domain-containing protein [Blastocatellia bacterium]
MSIPTVFISYSHLDELWKDRLVKHLGIAEKQGLLQTWNDRNLLGGDDWFAEIINAIERGSVAVLLVSHNSLTSGFILNEEVPRMLAQHKVQVARFYPIVTADSAVLST